MLVTKAKLATFLIYISCAKFIDDKKNCSSQFANFGAVKYINPTKG